MGSRYGGLKQIDPVDDAGHIIIDYSIYDAMKAGFRDFVFIIKKEIEEDFRQVMDQHTKGKDINVSYVFQELYKLPDGFTVPDGRTKPWGTSHALICAREFVDDNFAVINADDFYGRDAFVKLAEHLNSIKTTDTNYCMIGYVLRNTLTENGTVSRGQCATKGDGMLDFIVERTKIRTNGPDAQYLGEDDEWIDLPGDTLVSMNCWGLTPAIFDELESGFVSFLSGEGGKALKSEYYLPGAIDEMMHADKCNVKVYATTASWYGVTYSEDKASVKQSLKALMNGVEYPEKLWK
jgi:UTP-glucose-1-phosphate uridylyltransferase